jgi:hypothetical protein
LGHEAISLGIAHGTVASFAVGYEVMFETSKWLQSLLEKGGVIFIPCDANGGPGVRLKR